MVSPIKMREVIGDGGITSRSHPAWNFGGMGHRGRLGQRNPAPVENASFTIWVNDHISLPWIISESWWILRPFWDDSPTINHDKPGFGRTGFGRDEIYPVPSFRIRRLRAAIWDTSCGEKPPTLRGAEFIGRCRLCGTTSGKSSKTHRKPYEPWLL